MNGIIAEYNQNEKIHKTKRQKHQERKASRYTLLTAVFLGALEYTISTSTVVTILGDDVTGGELGSLVVETPTLADRDALAVGLQGRGVIKSYTFPSP